MVDIHAMIRCQWYVTCYGLWCSVNFVSQGRTHMGVPWDHEVLCVLMLSKLRFLTYSQDITCAFEEECNLREETNTNYWLERTSTKDQGHIVS